MLEVLAFLRSKPRCTSRGVFGAPSAAGGLKSNPDGGCLTDQLGLQSLDGSNIAERCANHC